MFLEEVLAQKKAELQHLRSAQRLSELPRQCLRLPPTRPLTEALSRPGRMRLIAEMKKASPSKGLLREEFDPSTFASIYQRAGADAISVLTDEHYFRGSSSHLEEARRACNLPVLRKDFIIDPYQVYRSRLIGADAILLIVRALEQQALRELYQLAGELQMDSLVEVHTQEELERALEIGARIIGINNRDLDTFTIDLETTIALRPLIPEGVLVVSESGIKSARDIVRLRKVGIDALLVGEAFMKSEDIAQTVSQFLTWMEG